MLSAQASADEFYLCSKMETKSSSKTCKKLINFKIDTESDVDVDLGLECFY